MMRRSMVLVAVLSALLTTAAPAGIAGPATETVLVVTLGDGTTMGSSSLGRSAGGIRATIRTGGLTAGHAYTVWAVVFNNPGACDGPCDAADLANPAAAAASLLGSGAVVRSSRAVFTVQLLAGDGLTDPHGAEVHFVVRTHGPAIPGLVAEQTSTLNGGCPPNTCANELAAIHH